jgi:hypothetical protein
MMDTNQKRLALCAGPQGQPRWWLARALWGVVWWGLPFFLIWAVAGPLLGGRGLDAWGIANDAALSAVGGALFGLVVCAISGRSQGSPKK